MSRSKVFLDRLFYKSSGTRVLKERPKSSERKKTGACCSTRTRFKI